MRSINKNAPVKCSNAIIINADVEKVWKVLTNINDWDTWQTDISKPKLNGALKPESTFDWKTGGTKIHSKLHTIDPLKKFGWTGETLGIFAIHNWTLKVINGQTHVYVDESMEGFLAKILKNTFNRKLQTGMQNWLILLKQHCEL